MYFSCRILHSAGSSSILHPNYHLQPPQPSQRIPSSQPPVRRFRRHQSCRQQQRKDSERPCSGHCTVSGHGSNAAARLHLLCHGAEVVQQRLLTVFTVQQGFWVSWQWLNKGLWVVSHWLLQIYYLQALNYKIRVSWDHLSNSMNLFNCMILVSRDWKSLLMFLSTLLFPFSPPAKKRKENIIMHCHCNFALVVHLLQMFAVLVMQP